MPSSTKTRTPRIVQPNSAARWFGVAAWFGFDYGREWAGFAASDSSRAVRRLRESVSALEDERLELRQKVAILQRSGQIDREASRLAQEELKKIQEEKMELEKDVEFLRNLVEESATGGLRVKDFKLSARDSLREYSYSFTVSQTKKDFGVSQGNIHITVVGSQGGEAKALDLAALTMDKTDRQRMRFRHFQNVQGMIRLPEGFSPDSVTVDIRPTTKKLAPLTQDFDWVVGG